MNCANFLEYNPKIYIIFWNTIHKIHAFCDYVYQNQTELYRIARLAAIDRVAGTTYAQVIAWVRSRTNGQECARHSPLRCYRHGLNILHFLLTRYLIS